MSFEAVLGQHRAEYTVHTLNRRKKRGIFEVQPPVWLFVSLRLSVHIGVPRTHLTLSRTLAKRWPLASP